MDVREEERALIGAAILDEGIARLLLTELRDDDLTDPTCRAVLWAIA